MHSLNNKRSADSSSSVQSFLSDVLMGLARAPRAIPPRWFYDKRGSELFEAITELPEYYPTRSEQQILSLQIDAIVRVVGRSRTLVEFGSGSSSKTALLLQQTGAAAYVPIDISGEFLRSSVADLQKRVAGVAMYPMEADFCYPIVLPRIANDHARLGFFPGSTIGNASEADAVDLLRRMGDTLGAGAMLLIGMDRYKDAQTLISAYDDPRGVTAKFNLNLLRRMQQELSAELELDAFGHLVKWNEPRSRIEMHLEARRLTTIRLAGREFRFSPGETIHTENSYKLRPGEARFLLRAGGWAPLEEWTDAQGLFSVYAASRVIDP